VPVEKLPGFSRGLVSVQDEAAQLAAILLDPAAGDHILDACSAPGGKSCHLLEVEPEITLHSVDSDLDRLALVQENFTRLGIRGDIIHQDLLQIKDNQISQFDKVLLDAPCSATGVIRRHPDIKLLRQSSDIDKLGSTQRQLLENCWSMLKPQGDLVYATCSVLPQENEDLVAEFVQRHANAQPIGINLTIGKSQGIGHQLLPTIGAHDGFYFAHLRKTSAGKAL
jgi:16S rRNA (cytosine967-C5)-methyltransferase